jgi:oligopeptide transport system substrate-binding protein
VKNKAVLLLTLAALVIPWQATRATTVLPPGAAPDAQQVLTIPGGSQEGPYLDEDLTIYNRQDGTDLIQDPLVVYDPTTNKLNPVAATSWSVSPDKLTWTFHIRKGMTWTDGQPVTSADFAGPLINQASPKTAPAYDFTYWTEVVQGIKNWAAVNSGKMPISALGVGTPDPYTLTITTDAPRSYLPAAMVYTWAEPAHVFNKVGPTWATAPHVSDMVFSGPYEVQSWQPGVALTLVRNPMYHGVRKAPFSKIIWKIPGGDALAQFQTNQISWTPQLDTGELAAAQHTSPSDIVKQSSYDVWYLSYNTAMKPFNDLRVRQAFNLAIDRQTLANDVLKGTAIPNYTLLMPGFPGFDKTMTVPYNVAKAQQLLAAAGYPGGKGFPSITIYLRNSSGEVSMSQPSAVFVQSEIKNNLGINLDVKVIDQKTFTAEINKHQLPLFEVGYNYDYVDASDFMDLFVCTSSSCGRHAWSNAQYNQTVGAADHSFDTATRAKLYEQALQIMAAQVPASFLYVPEYSFLVNPKLVNYPTLPQQTDDWMLKAYFKS